MNEIVKDIQKHEVKIYNKSGQIIEIKEHSKTVTIANQEFSVNAMELARMIRNVTQQIGHHKRTGNAYSAYLLNNLRNMRNEMIADLESNFRIGHLINDSGRSVFYKLGKQQNEPELLIRNENRRRISR